MRNIGCFRIAFAALLSLLSAPLSESTAGDRIGNGGSSWVCRVGGAIEWASLTDIYEARHELGLTIPPTAPDAEALILRASREFHEALVPHLEAVKRAFRLLDGWQGLAAIPDVLPRIFPKPESCPGGEARLEQLANFTPTGELIVDREIWERLPEVDQAALVVHEAIYGLLRDRQAARDSRLARRLTGFAFSTAPVESYAAEFRLPPAPDEPGWIESLSTEPALRMALNGSRLRISIDNRDGAADLLCTGHVVAMLGHRRYAIPFKEEFGGRGALAPSGQRIARIIDLEHRPWHSQMRPGGPPPHVGRYAYYLGGCSAPSSDPSRVSGKSWTPSR